MFEFFLFFHSTALEQLSAPIDTISWILKTQIHVWFSFPCFLLFWFFFFYTPRTTLSTNNCSTMAIQNPSSCSIFFHFFSYTPKQLLAPIVAWPLPFQTRAHVQFLFIFPCTLQTTLSVEQLPCVIFFLHLPSNFWHWKLFGHENITRKNSSCSSSPKLT